MFESRCIGVVLAGGRSTRMKQDKSLLTHTTHQATMVEFSQQNLNNAGLNQVVTSQNFNAQAAERDQISDQFNNIGPIGGIASVFEKLPHATGYLFLPVDLPLLTTELLTKLIQQGQLSQKACYFSEHFLPLYLPRNGYSELFFQTLSQNQINNVTHHGKNKALSIRAMLNQIPSHEIALSKPEQHQLFNCNTPEQWQEAQNYLKK